MGEFEEIETILERELAETLTSLEGSFCVVNNKKAPGEYVQWIREEVGIRVEVADTEYQTDEPMDAQRVARIKELGFEAGDPNFFAVFSDIRKAVPLVLSALTEVFEIRDADELEVSVYLEDPSTRESETPFGDSVAERFTNVLRIVALAAEHLDACLEDLDGEESVSDQDVEVKLDPPLPPDVWESNPTALLEQEIVHMVAVSFFQRAEGSGLARLELAQQLASDFSQLPFELEWLDD